MIMLLDSFPTEQEPQNTILGSPPHIGKKVQNYFKIKI